MPKTRAKANQPTPRGGEIVPAAAPDDPQWQEEFFLRKRLEAARIPRRFINKSLETFSARDKQRKGLVRNAKAYISGFNFKTDYPRGLFMTGHIGSGKTHLAVSILRGVIEKGYSGLFYNSPELLRDIRATFDKSNEDREEDLLEEVTTTDLLVFDDVGAENITGFVLDRFYLIINKRYEACKPIVLTTNLDLETFENRLGNRILSRILEMCGMFGPYFPEEDWRRKYLSGK